MYNIFFIYLQIFFGDFSHNQRLFSLFIIIKNMYHIYIYYLFRRFWSPSGAYWAESKDGTGGRKSFIKAIVVSVALYAFVVAPFGYRNMVNFFMSCFLFFKKILHF